MNPLKIYKESKRTWLRSAFAILLACFLWSNPMVAQVCDAEAGGTVTFSATGGNTDAGFTEVYLLTLTDGTIVATSTTTSFSNVDAGTFNIYALNYETADPPSNFSVNDNVSDITGGCFDLSSSIACFVCSTDCSCFSGDPFTLTATGGNMDPDYIEVYVLTDDAGLIVDIQNSPTFNVSTPTDATYFAYAVNYFDDASISGLTLGQPISGVTADCIDITTDPLQLRICAKLGSIGNYVWLDENSDGFQDPGEPGLPNVLVNLYGDPDGDGTVQLVATTVTDSDGGYIFTDLPAGDYFIQVDETTLPDTDNDGNTVDLTQSPIQNPNADFGNQDQGTSIPDVGGTGYPVTLDAGEENPTADFGYNYNPPTDVDGGMNTATLGDRVWIDSDGDGVQDPNEVGVSGVEVTLTGAGVDGIFGTGDDITDMTTTDENGYYIFDGLLPGAYVTEVTNDAGASHAILTAGEYTQTGDPDDFGMVAIAPDNAQTDPIILGPGDVFLNSDYGYQPLGADDELGSIGDLVYLDADADGIKDAEEEPIAGVSVVLIQDTNGNGIWDVGEPIIATDVSDEDGMYLFEDLPADDYLVFVNDTDNVLDGLENSADPDGNNNGDATGLGDEADMVGGMSALTLGVNEDNLDQDFGYTPEGNEPGDGFIGNYVWLDVDGDDTGGQTEADSEGDVGIEGVVVELLDDMNNVIATTTTDENGFYGFGSLALDESYTVQIASENFTEGGVLAGLASTYEPGGGDQDDNQGAAVPLSVGTPGDLDQDFGYSVPAGDPTGTIGNLVWEDTNGDGIKDPTEMGIAGVTLDLYLDLNDNGTVDPGEPIIGTTTTASDGSYSFTGLPVDDEDGEDVSYIVDVSDEDGILNGYWHSLGTPNADDNSQADPYAVTLSDSNPINNTADFGYYVELAAVGNFVFLDENGNGIQDIGEMGIENVEVTLTVTYSDNTMTTVVTTTDMNGFYEFPNLLADEDHALGAGTGANGEASATPTATQPEFVISVDANQSVLTIASLIPTLTDVTTGGGTDLNDSDAFTGVVAIPVQGNTNTTTNADPTMEDVVASYDFGVKDGSLGSIGNYVWLDENSDGFQDPGEPGLPNVLVNLYGDPDGDGMVQLVATTVTDSDGGYIFTDLPAGDYFIQVDETTLPDTDGDVNTVDLTQSPIQNPNADFGNQDQGTSIPDVGGTGYPVTLDAGEENPTADFGYNYNPPTDVDGGMNTATLGDRVWIDSDGDGVQDPNEVGVSGVEVTLTGAGVDGIFGTGDDITDMTTTDENGYYIFDGLLPGAYVTEVTNDAGASHAILTAGEYTQTGDPDDFGMVAIAPDNAQTDPIILGPGDVFLNSDYGYQPLGADDELGSIGDLVYLDADADGIKDAEEEPIAGVSVVLIQDTNGNGIWDVGEPIIATDVSDEDGMYLFEDLPADDYLVFVNDTDNVLDGLENSADPDGNNNGDATGLGDEADMVGGMSALTLGVNEDNLDQDFGYTPEGNEPGDGFIGNYVWLDVDGDDTGGQTEADSEGDVGIEGVVVELLDDMNNVIATTTTDENGFYGFGSLALDESYTVQIASENFTEGGVLAGLASTYEPGGGDQDDNQGAAVPLSVGTPGDLDQDFGYSVPAGDPTGTIGNLVWEDTNGDGIKDPTEMGIAGVTLDLYLDLNDNGTVDPGEPIIGTTTTASDGSYSFTGLPVDDEDGEDVSYIVDVSDEDGILNGYWHSLGTPNADDNSQADPYAVTLSDSNPINNTADFGYYVELAAVGNFVFLDENGNGIQDIGEMGIENVEVTLTVTYSDNTMTTVVTTTDMNGFYEFPNLLADEDHALGAGTGANGEASATPTATQPEFVISVDANQSVLTIASLIPTLTDVTTGGGTDLNDSDAFTGVVAIPVQGNTNTTTNADPTMEDVVASYDFGVKDGSLGSIGNYVWLDENSDGFQDPGEPGLPNVLVNLYGDPDGDGMVQLVATTVTDSDGGYIFTDLPAGDYFIQVDETTLPDTDGDVNTVDLTQSPIQNPNADFGNQDQGTSIPDVGGTGYPVTLDAGEENPTADFGYNYNPPTDVDGGMNTATLGDRVWIDSDGDGVQDPNEVGVSGVEVTLTGAGVDGIFGTGDDITDMTTTNENGYYIFDGLLPGAYVTEVTNDAGASHAILTAGEYTQTGDPDDFGMVAIAPDNAQTDPIILGPGDVFLNSDYGYQPLGADDELGSIGDLVYLDADADGIKDAEEEPIAGVSVVLIQDTNGNGIWDVGEPIIATDVSDEDGMYLFEDLPADDYLVFVNDTDNVLDGLENSADPDGNNNGDATGLGDEADMVGGMSALTLGVNEDNLDQDFGYTPEGNEPGDGFIGNYVWLDVDGDDTGGQTEADSEGDVGIEGVVVELLDDMNNVIATTTTDENGFYGFGSLALDESYTVQIASENFTEGGVLAGLASTYEPGGGDQDDNQGAAVPLSVGTPGDLDQDFGYSVPAGDPTGTIGNLVWEDTNGDGIKDPTEMGIAGVTLDLYLDLNDNGTVDPGEPIIGTTTTASDGSYSFTGLPVDDEDGEDVSYIVDVSDEDGILNGYWHSLGTPNADDNSQADPYAVTLSDSNPINNTADFGYYVELAAVGNFVFLDENGNGIQDIGEMGIENVEVTLTVTYSDNTMTTVVTTTDMNGFYEFPNLLADEDHALGAGTGANGEASATPTATQPEFVISVDANQSVLTIASLIPTLTDVTTGGGTDLNDSDAFTGVVAIPVQGNTNTTTNADPTMEDVVASYDFGVKDGSLGSIGNYVWLDENSDGFQDPGEPGLPNVLVNLYGDPDGDGMVQLVATTVTDSDGGYIFTDLPAGDYFIQVDETTLPDTDGDVNTVDLTQSPIQNPNADFGNQDQGTSIPDVGGTGYPVTLDAGEENPTADFGYNYNPPTDVDGGMNTATLGDRVWIDSDGDGVQDPNEVGVSGVEVTLTGAGVDGIFGTGDDITDMTTTNENGYYIFDGLLPGAYVTEVTNDAGASHAILTAGEYTQTGDPDDFGMVAIAPDNAQTDPIILGPGDVFLNSDYGYQPLGADDELGSIGDLVYLDADADGIKDAEEEPIAGVSVVLIQDTNGNGIWDVGEPIIATDVSDEDGMYLFEDLPADDYLVFVNDTDNVLDGLENSADPDGNNNGDATGLGDEADMVGGMSALTLGVNEDNLDQDFGYTPEGNEPGDGFIGNYVWLDADGDDTGGQTEADSEGDVGIEGVVVELLDDMNNVIATTTTDENGFYGFGSLALDESYTVQIASENFTEGGVLAGLASTYEPGGGDQDDNQGAAVPLSVGTPGDLDQDFGYSVPAGDPTGTIGNLVWEDTNGDGIKDPTEMGIAGVTLDLYLDLNDNGTVDPGEPIIGTTTTASDGSYSFTGLPVDDEDGEDVSYIVDVSDEDGILNGYWHSLGTPNADDNSQADPYAVTLSDSNPINNTADFGYYVELAAVGNFVFEDTNRDGIQDMGESGIEGVVVTLEIVYFDATTVTIVTTTDMNGFYEFANLLADEDYRIGAGIAEGMPATATATMPAYTIKIVGQDGTSEPLEDLVATLVDQGTDELLDSQDPAGAAAIPVQGAENTTPQSPASGESDEARYDIGYTTCPDNSVLIGLALAPTTVAAVDDIIQVTFAVVNDGDSELTNANFDAERFLFPSGTATSITTNLIEQGTVDGKLSVGESWLYTASITVGSFNPGAVFAITGFFTADGSDICGMGSVEAATADLLFTVGVNMDVEIVSECYVPGEEIEVDLITRLLVDEDAAKNPGTINVGGILVPLPKRQYEARNLMITLNDFNGDMPFDPFNPPLGLDIVAYNDQGGIDDGRNNAMVLDECEPINTVRAPCSIMGENDINCEFPDWVFRVKVTVPENQVGTYTVTSSDDFDLFEAVESPTGSDTYGAFNDITSPENSGGEDSENLEECPMDYGDLPDIAMGTSAGNYQTIASDNGPVHYIDPARELYIGAIVDADNGMLQDNTAMADDLDGMDDEEFNLPIFDTGTPNVTLTIPVVNNTGEDAKFYAFIDWNADGDFTDAGEAIAPITVSIQGSSNVILSITVPEIAFDNQVGIRFRLTTDMDLMNSVGDRSIGTARDGEVEDYLSSTVLPVELVSFKARADKDHIDLTWATASELNNSHFELERSEDGKVFKQIAIIQGKGTILEQSDYLYEDHEAVAGVLYYYQLKQVDFDGVFEYSEIRAAKIEAEVGGMDVYPNPIGDDLDLKVDFYTDDLVAEFIITDMHNRSVLQVKQDLQQSGWNSIVINVASLPAGTYILMDKAGNVRRFVKARE